MTGNEKGHAANVAQGFTNCSGPGYDRRGQLASRATGSKQARSCIQALQDAFGKSCGTIRPLQPIEPTQDDPRGILPHLNQRGR